MTKPASTISLRVDPTNPGQVFGCFGLLELADRLWNGAEGWFERQAFCMQPLCDSRTPAATAAGLVDALCGCRLTNAMTDKQIRRLTELSGMKAAERSKSSELDAEKKSLESLRRESPIVLHAPFNLQIDWFLDDWAGGSRFKTWAGQQSVIDIAEAMHVALTKNLWSETSTDQWLGRSVSIDSLPFNFDSTLSGQGSSLDAGFSFDALGFKMPSRPLLELTAFIGLQRFRPRQKSNENLYYFDLWSTPLLPSIAAAVACGAAVLQGTTRYEFRLLYRTKYLKSFLPAQPCRGLDP